jgi:hypothetical protein
MSDGCVPILLGKTWCGHVLGDVVRVDPERAEQLRRDGYEEAPVEVLPQSAKSLRKKRGTADV